MPDMKCKAWQILHRKTVQRVMRCRLKCVNAVERDRRSGIFLEDIGWTREKAQEALTDILRKHSETIGFMQHPFQRSKRVTGAGVLDHGELWHCKHMRKYGSTLTCQFRCTAQCGFKIKYQFKNNRLKVYVQVGRAQSRE
jgi:hypothetical protein